MNTLKFLVVVLWAAGACRRIIRKRLNGIARQQNKGTALQKSLEKQIRKNKNSVIVIFPAGSLAE